MSDDITPVEETGVADTSPETGTEQQVPPGFIEEARYKEAQSWGTRASQEAAQYRQLIEGLQSPDSDTRREAAQALNLEFLEEEPTDDFVDPNEALVQRLERLEQERAQDKAAETQQKQIAQLETAAERDMDKLEVPAHLRDWVVARAVALPGTPDGTLDIGSAWTEYGAVRDAEMKAWRETKRAPHVSSGGQQATHTPNMDDDAERQRWMQQQLADLNAAS